MMAEARQLPIAQLREVADALQSVIAMMAPMGRPASEALTTRPMQPADPGVVRLYVRTRRLRDLYFPPAMFADPAWDILLDLYAAGQEGADISVSSACIAAAVPQATALRHIGSLERAGIIARAADPFDRRRFYLELSDAGRHAMRDYFAAVATMVAKDAARR